MDVRLRQMLDDGRPPDKRWPMIGCRALHALQIGLGVGVFVLLNDLMAMALHAVGILLPGAVAGLVVFLLFLLTIPYKSCHDFFKPACDLLLLWLPFLFVPALVDFPLIVTLIPTWDYPKLAVVIILGVIAISSLGGWLLIGLSFLHFRITSQPEAVQLSEGRHEPARKKGLFGSKTVISLLAFAFILSIVFAFFAHLRHPLLVVIMLIIMPATYTLGQYPSRKYPRGHYPNPVIIASALSICVVYGLASVTNLSFMTLLRQIHSGAQMSIIDGYSPAIGAGDIYLYLLNAAIIAMALPVSQQKHSLLIHGFDMLVAAGIISFASIVLTLALCRMLFISDLVSRSFALRTVTAPIAMASVTFIQGNPGIAGAASVVTGVAGGVFWRRLVEAPFNRFANPLVRGFSIGCSCHGLGTAILSVDEPESSPFSTVAFVAVGVVSSVLVSIPGLRHLIEVILS